MLFVGHFGWEGQKIIFVISLGGLLMNKDKSIYVKKLENRNQNNQKKKKHYLFLTPPFSFPFPPENFFMILFMALSKLPSLASSSSFPNIGWLFLPSKCPLLLFPLSLPPSLFFEQEKWKLFYMLLVFFLLFVW